LQSKKKTAMRPQKMEEKRTAMVTETVRRKRKARNNKTRAQKAATPTQSRKTKRTTMTKTASRSPRRGSADRAKRPRNRRLVPKRLKRNSFTKRPRYSCEIWHLPSLNRTSRRSQRTTTGSSASRCPIQLPRGAFSDVVGSLSSHMSMFARSATLYKISKYGTEIL
jgi:hypothetical protein